MKLSRSLLIVTAVTCTVLYAAHPCFAQDAKGAGALTTVMPKSRVAVVSVPPGENSADGGPAFVLNLDAWKALLLQEGVVLPEKEWATAADVTKAAISAGSTFLLVDVPSAWSVGKDAPSWKSGTESAPDFLLVAKYALAGDGRNVGFRLVCPHSGVTVASAGTTADDLEKAVKEALDSLADDVALMAWRCRVTGVKDKVMIIDRGRRDGISEGLELTGYTIAKDAKENINAWDEKSIMLHGKRSGTYKVEEVGNAFSKVVPTEKSPALSEGDILEIPELRLPGRRTKTRGHRAWDSIYEDAK